MSAVEAMVLPRSGVRDPIGDHLITSQNSVMVLIDFQPLQIAAVQSREQPPGLPSPGPSAGTGIVNDRSST
jgi:hypothetical protein